MIYYLYDADKDSNKFYHRDHCFTENVSSPSMSQKVGFLCSFLYLFSRRQIKTGNKIKVKMSQCLIRYIKLQKGEDCFIVVCIYNKLGISSPFPYLYSKLFVLLNVSLVISTILFKNTNSSIV